MVIILESRQVQVQVKHIHLTRSWNGFKQTDGRTITEKKQNVICITYTNAAVNVISERLANDSFILPSTIHAFAWRAVQQYQSALIKIVRENSKLHPREGDIDEISGIQYTLGHRYMKDGILYLYHDDVIILFCTLLENAKFRSMFSNLYPLILIDEYQDSFQEVINRFIEYFIAKGVGPQFGFFGDAWQTIYQSNKVCGKIEHENIVEIKKSSNFRSAPKIVDILNILRPTIPQQSAIDQFDGEVLVITQTVKRYLEHLRMQYLFVFPINFIMKL